MFSGDPLDRSLRKVEIDILIPKKMRDKARDEKCSEEVNGKSHKYTYCSHYKLYLITSVYYFIVYIYMHIHTHTCTVCRAQQTYSSGCPDMHTKSRMTSSKVHIPFIK